MASFKAQQFITPRGELKFPNVTRPSYGFKSKDGAKEYIFEGGLWSTKMVFSKTDPAAQNLIAQLQPILDATVARAQSEFDALPPIAKKRAKPIDVNNFYTDALDPETAEPTGQIEFTFKLRFSGQYKTGKRAGETWEKHVPLFDSRRKEIPESARPEVWGGTEAKISFEVPVDFKTGNPGYYIAATGAVGIKLQLIAVQIINLKSGSSSAVTGFVDEGDGFCAFPTETDKPFASETSAQDLEDDDEVPF